MQFEVTNYGTINIYGFVTVGHGTYLLRLRDNSNFTIMERELVILDH